MMPGMRVLAGAVVCLLGLASVPAGTLDAGADGQPGPPARRGSHWTSQVKRVVLDNGLTVLLLQRGSLPIVSVEALYKVGSRNERPGLTGAAHYIEHMAFRRTERINKGDLTNQVLRWGGRWGGYTSYDQTVYNAHAPSAYLDWLIFMERQRLQHVLFDAESVELERTSVISELREYENSPQYTMAEHRLRRAAMVAHPYGSPIMGWISDLQAIAPADLERFYRDHYAANNLVLAIVGRFDEAEALALVRRHFDDAPGTGRSTRLITVEPAQTGARRVVHRGPGATSHIELLVHAPAGGDPRYPTLLVLDAALAGGKAEGRAPARSGSRLHAALVQSGLAQAVSTEVELSEYPGLHAVSVTAAPDADLAKVEAALGAALQAMAREVTDSEVRMAVEQVIAAFALRDDSNRAIADRLARFEGIGSYTLLARIIEGVGTVTAADVRALASEMFAADRRNVGWFVPQGSAVTPVTTDTDAGRSHTAPAEIAQRHAGTVTPPAASAVLPDLPAVSLRTLPNGLTVGVVRLDGDLVHVRMRVAAGALHDPRDREGLALVTARALTARVSDVQAADLGPRGIRLVSSASSIEEPFDNRHFVEWSAAMRREDLGSVLSAMARIVSAPAPEADVVTRARDALLDEVEAVQDDSRWRATDAAWTALYPPSHPLGRPVHGTAASLNIITADDVSRFTRAHYVPLKTTVVIAGGVTDAEARAGASAFGGWRPDPATGGVPQVIEPPAPDRWPTVSGAGGRDVHIAMPHKEQASITVALPAADATSADYPAVSLLNYLLGETGYAGRLGETLVDTGIAYAVYASLWPYRGAGPLLVTTDAVQAREAVTRIRAALTRFTARGVTAAQLEEARGFVLGRLLFRFETPASASVTVADLATVGLGAQGLSAFAERVRGVTLPQLNAAAARYYDPARAAFVIAGR